MSMQFYIQRKGMNVKLYTVFTLKSLVELETINTIWFILTMNSFHAPRACFLYVDRCDCDRMAFGFIHVIM